MTYEMQVAALIATCILAGVALDETVRAVIEWLRS